MTYTLEHGYGLGAVVAGAGFLLNNEMGDFNGKPGRDRQHGIDRHRAEPRATGQADVVEHDTVDSGEGRQAVRGNRQLRADALLSTR